MHLRHAPGAAAAACREARGEASRAGRRHAVPHVTDYLSVFLGRWDATLGRRLSPRFAPGAPRRTGDGRRTGHGNVPGPGARAD